MKAGHPSIKEVTRRFLFLRCPACGASGIVSGPFHIAGVCSKCGALFKREEGFFVGALLINVVTTELVILLAYFATLPIIGINYTYVLAALFIIAVIFPIAFYHHSWSLWLTFDHLVEGLPVRTHL